MQRLEESQPTVPVFPDLKDKVVIITGAAGGIGRAITELFAAQGCRLVVVGRTRDQLESLAATLAAQEGVSVLPVPCDITLETDIQALMQAAGDRFDGVNVLINNAASHQPAARVREMDIGVWQQVITTNLSGTMLCCKHAAPALVASGSGAIVNVGSLSGHRPRLMNSAYASSKAGIEHLTRTLALELAGDGVRVNAVTPGSTETPMLRAASARDGEASNDYRVRGDLSLFRSPIPLRRIAEPREQALPIVFLASAAASYITGQVLSVDGGEGLV